MMRRMIILAALLAGLACGGVAMARSGSPQTVRAFALYARGDYKTAAETLLAPAWRGEARAQGLLGFLYEYGKGVPQDYAAAAGWYGCAAGQGEATAQYLLGLLYDKGHGVPQDVVLSQQWLILAAAGASAQERDMYTRIRDAVAGKMSTAQHVLAQRLAADWRPAPAWLPGSSACWPAARPVEAVGWAKAGCTVGSPAGRAPAVCTK